MSELASRLRQAWLQSQIAKDVGPSRPIPHAQQHKEHELALQPNSEKLASLASMLLDEDSPVMPVNSFHSIYLELQELVCPDTLFGFEFQDDTKLGYSSDSAQLLAAQNSTLHGSMQVTRVYEETLHKLGMLNLELIDMLVDCASFMSRGHLAEAKAMIKILMQQAPPSGNATHRLVYAFLEGLVARLYNTPVNNNFQLSLEENLRLSKVSIQTTPLCRVTYYFANQNILKACEGFNRVHVVDYGISNYGFQWPSLLRELATRSGGPPELRITLIDNPSAGLLKKNMEEISMRLTDYATSRRICLMVHTIEEKWENVQLADLCPREGESLIVNSMLKGQSLIEESLIPESPRKQWIKRVANMKPRLFTMSMNNIAGTAPIFLNRFVEILPFYATIFNMIETCMEDGEERQWLEQFKFGEQIVNMVSCEGLERTERPEIYNLWHSRMVSEGFQLLPPQLSLLQRCDYIVGSYQKPFSSQTDLGWFHICWKDFTIMSMSAWTFPQSTILSPATNIF